MMNFSLGQRWTVVKTTLIAMLFAGFLAACDDAESRAEKHFQNALSLMESGDYDRATIEFRNVFKLNADHRDARLAYANMRREMEDYPEALGQFQRLAEQFPGDIEALTALVEIYADLGAWEQLSKFVDEGLAAAPDSDVFKEYAVVRDYRVAVEARDAAAAVQAAEAAEPMLEARPDALPLRRILIDDKMRRGQMEEALEQLDLALTYAPDEQSLFPVRLSVLAALGDTFAMEDQLRANMAAFPENEDYRLTLVRFLVLQDRISDAEDVLRQAIEDKPQDLERRMTLVQFLKDFQGSDKAIEELDQMIVKGFDQPEVLARRATIVYATGAHDRAIEQMEELVAKLSDNPDASREIRVDLALMYKLKGDVARGRELIDGVVAEDNAHVAARKMQANWLIDDDETGDAIAALRIALEQNPNDPQIYTLLARAHNRDGNDELVGDMLALAVDASGGRAEESIHYAQYLLTRDKLGPAETVIIDSLRVEPTNEKLLELLGVVYVKLREPGRLKQVIGTLETIGTPEAKLLANDLTTRMLQIQNRADETVAFLQRLIESGGQTSMDADAIIVRTHLANAQPERAIAYLEAQQAERPDDADLDFLMAAVLSANGDQEKAEAGFEDLVTRHPENQRYWKGYFDHLFGLGREADALAVVDRGISAADDTSTLRWIRASFHERAGEIDKAIAIYEDMYDADKGNMIIANNLANLLVQGTPDDATVARAYRIARRLGASDIPPYLDTYGWISVLRGDYSEGIRALEPAASAMKEDAQVQYHLARAYQGANRLQAALAQFGEVLALVDNADTRDFVVDARAQVEKLSNDPAANTSN